LIQVKSVAARRGTIVGMESDPEAIREKIRRYRELHRLNPDPMARRALEEAIRDLEGQLNDDSDHRS